MTNPASARIGRVLVAVDLSPAADAVIERAAGLPLAPAAQITLLHVIPGDAGGDPGARERAEAAVASCAARFLDRAAGGTRVVTALAHGAPFVEIIRRAREEAAELIVLGRHGHRTFTDALIGSTAERVLRKGDLATLIVASAPDGPYRRPLVAVDLSDTSRQALELALRVIAADAEPVAVVHAWGAADAGDPRERDGSALGEFLAGFGAAAARWHVTVRPGDARSLVLGEAARYRADLLVLGTHGRSGIAHLLVGSVAEAVVRGATCDVLVARAVRRGFRLP